MHVARSLRPTYTATRGGQASFGWGEIGLSHFDVNHKLNPLFGAPVELRDREFVGVEWRICGDFIDIYQQFLNILSTIPLHIIYIHKKSTYTPYHTHNLYT